MLSAFPALLSWEQLSPLLIRIVLGVIFMHWGYMRLRKNNSSTGSKAVGVVDVILGALVFIGLWTQVAAMIIGLDLVWRIVKKFREKALLTDGVNYYLILLALAISLIVTGAGWWGFDLAI